MTEKFRSYVPELLFGDRKQETPARICHEDFAVVDPTNQYRILAGRGLYAQAELSLPRVWQIPCAELSWLEEILQRHRRVLLNGGDGPVLVFADLLNTTGLLFAVRPYLPIKTLVRGLRHLGRQDIVISPAVEVSFSQTFPEESALTQISELFYYMDRMFDSSDRFEIGAWTRTRLIATFVGCKLEEVDLPIAEPIPSRVERDRLTAFLICALLELRKMDGRVSVWARMPPLTFVVA